VTWERNWPGLQEIQNCSESVTLCRASLTKGRFQYLGNYSNACGTASGPGCKNFLGNLAGWIAPVVTGLVVDNTGRFFWAFIITAVIALLARCPGYLLSALFNRWIGHLAPPTQTRADL
jgi:hypothetical protein